jgi:hypothetical protein
MPSITGNCVSKEKGYSLLLYFFLIILVMFRKLIAIFLLLVFSIMAVVFFYLLSKEQKPNGFQRKLLDQTLVPVNVLDLGHNAYYIAGAGVSSIYLANTANALHLMTVDNGFIRRNTFQLANKDTTPLIASLVRVDSPHIYILDWQHHRFLYGNLNGLSVLPVMSDTAYISDGVALSPSSFITKKRWDRGRRYVLVKRANGSISSIIGDGLLQYQTDSLFSIDGMIDYEPGTDRFVFVYYYRNEFFAADTNLKLLYRTRLVDTNSIAKISTARIASEGVRTLSAPPLLVNKKSCMYANRLFVYSMLKADNETQSTFEKNEVIDVYDTQRGRYSYSFYLPRFRGERLQSFSCFGKSLLAIFGRYLVCFSLNP